MEDFDLKVLVRPLRIDGDSVLYRGIRIPFPEKQDRFSDVPEQLVQMQEQQTHCDLVFVCDGLHVWCHQTLLATKSKLVKSLMKDNSCCKCQGLQCINKRDDLYISLDGVRMADLTALLQILYLGYAKITSKTAFRRVKAIERMLQMEDLNLDLDVARVPFDDEVEEGYQESEIDELVLDEEFCPTFKPPTRYRRPNPKPQSRRPKPKPKPKKPKEPKKTSESTRKTSESSRKTPKSGLKRPLSVDSPSIQCPECPESFGSEQLIQQHLSKKHGKNMSGGFGDCRVNVTDCVLIKRPKLVNGFPMLVDSPLPPSSHEDSDELISNSSSVDVTINKDQCPICQLPLGSRSNSSKLEHLCHHYEKKIIEFFGPKRGPRNLCPICKTRVEPGKMFSHLGCKHEKVLEFLKKEELFQAKKWIK